MASQATSNGAIAPTASTSSLSSMSSLNTNGTPVSSTPSPVTPANDVSQTPLIKIGVCAMDRKARSKPMRNILSRLLATNKFDIQIFGDKCILDEDVENWPVCDFLISFHSDDFPLKKAIEYVHLRKPQCINDLLMQEIFWDRRLVLAILDKVGVRTPPRIEVDRDGGPQIDKQVADAVFRAVGIRIDTPRQEGSFSYDEDKVEYNGKVIRKPYVEKPVSGEDHNINILFGKKRGGGGRRLFRKIGNKSSELDPELSLPRMDGGSYVYEQFMDVENAEDIKAYTLGPNYVHAETRKSPAVDGVVRRNLDGKELRYVTELTDEEKEMARRIATAFKQNVCGFDLLRANGKSYVIDVNGWSFVKGNEVYYDKCAEILERFCTDHTANTRQLGSPAKPFADPPVKDKSWMLKGAVSVFRHADRTPKMKLKYNIKGSWSWSAPFIDLLQGRRDEIILRADSQLQYIAEAADKALEHPDSDKEMLASLKKILEKKIGTSGTKAQLKPTFAGQGEDAHCEKLNIIIKWGGEFTHAGRYQSMDLGDNMRKDYAILNKSLQEHATISSSSELRAIATATVFAGSILKDSRNSKQRQDPGQLVIRKDLLDDSNAAKEPMDKVKRRLKVLLRPGEYKRPEFAMSWRVPDVEPQQIVQETVELLRLHRKIMRENWATLDIENIQDRWCCHEYPELWKERWDKIFAEFCDVEPEKFDPSRISELYDSIKFDALHNHTFLVKMFTPAISVPPTPVDKKAPALIATPELKSLYEKAKILFDYIAPAEYGITKEEKLEIGVLTSWPLLQQVLEDLTAARDSADGTMALYFTKESHIQTLVNLVLLSELPIVMPKLPELDYMSYITFELYERVKGDNTEFSVRVALSEGAHSLPLDASLDAKHALSVQPRRVLTNHIPFPQAFETLNNYAKSELYKKSAATFEGMLPVEGDELFTGRKDELVQFIEVDFKQGRPQSVASHRDGNASETSSIA